MDIPIDQKKTGPDISATTVGPVQHRTHSTIFSSQLCSFLTDQVSRLTVTAAGRY